MFENLKKYKTLYNKRFTIFEIENFLSEENYKNIYDNFPKLNNFSNLTKGINSSTFKIESSREKYFLKI